MIFNASVLSGYVTPRRGPSREYDFVNELKTNAPGIFLCNKWTPDTQNPKNVWLQLDLGYYVPYYYDGKTYLSVPSNIQAEIDAYLNKMGVSRVSGPGSTNNSQAPVTNNSNIWHLPDENLSTDKIGSVQEDNIDYVAKFYEANEYGFPKTYKARQSDGSVKTIADYSINFSADFMSTVNAVRKNLNVVTAYDKHALNTKYHYNFNRFRMEFPDIVLRNTLGYVVFTRPDLNLYSYSSKSGIYDTTKLSPEMVVDPRMRYLAAHNPALAKGLTKDGIKGHNFNPFLSNMVQSLEVMDDSVDTLETGETFTGYKTLYSKNNIKSITAGNLSIKFKETFDIGVTNMFQLWVDYQSNVYKGVFTPKNEYIWQKVIDYACDIYYFLLDQDGETILFWSKYYGCFPINVGKSVFSFDYGGQVQMPDITQTFAYMYKEDLTPNTLVEFNQDAGISSSNKAIPYIPVYNKAYGHSGSTWAGVPFVSTYSASNGLVTNSQGFKLRFSPEKTITDLSPGPLTI